MFARILLMASLLTAAAQALDLDHEPALCPEIDGIYHWPSAPDTNAVDTWIIQRTNQGYGLSTFIGEHHVSTKVYFFGADAFCVPMSWGASFPEPTLVIEHHDAASETWRQHYYRLSTSSDGKRKTLHRATPAFLEEEMLAEGFIFMSYRGSLLKAHFATLSQVTLGGVDESRGLDNVPPPTEEWTEFSEFLSTSPCAESPGFPPVYNVEPPAVTREAETTTRIVNPKTKTDSTSSRTETKKLVFSMTKTIAKNEQPKIGRQRLIWHAPLHQKMIRAFTELATQEKKRPVPSAVLKQMCVSGLERKHVASHMQKSKKQLDALMTEIREEASLSKIGDKVKLQMDDEAL